jgi:hypothetical protein
MGLGRVRTGFLFNGVYMSRGSDRDRSRFQIGQGRGRALMRRRCSAEVYRMSHRSTMSRWAYEGSQCWLPPVCCIEVKYDSVGSNFPASFSAQAKSGTDSEERQSQ